jgi:hypothetical protein
MANNTDGNDDMNSMNDFLLTITIETLMVVGQTQMRKVVICKLFKIKINNLNRTKRATSPLIPTWSNTIRQLIVNLYHRSFMSPQFTLHTACIQLCGRLGFCTVDTHAASAGIHVHASTCLKVLLFTYGSRTLSNRNFSAPSSKAHTQQAMGITVTSLTVGV